MTRWGCKVAGENVIPAYLQSSPAGYQSYRKCRFDEVYVADLNLKDLGGDGICRNWLMVKLPQAKSSAEVAGR